MGAEGGGVVGKRGRGEWSVARGGLCASGGASHRWASCVKLRSTPPRQPAAKLGEEAVLGEAQGPAFGTTLRECPACKVDLSEGRTSARGGRAWCHGKNVFMCMCVFPKFYSGAYMCNKFIIWQTGNFTVSTTGFGRSECLAEKDSNPLDIFSCIESFGSISHKVKH